MLWYHAECDMARVVLMKGARVAKAVFCKKHDLHMDAKPAAKQENPLHYAHSLVTQSHMMKCTWG